MGETIIPRYHEISKFQQCGLLRPCCCPDLHTDDLNVEVYDLQMKLDDQTAEWSAAYNI